MVGAGGELPGCGGSWVKLCQPLGHALCVEQGLRGLLPLPNLDMRVFCIGAVDGRDGIVQFVLIHRSSIELMS